MRNADKKKLGFSIVSVLVAMGLLGIIATIVSTFINNSFGTLKKFETLSDTQDIRRIMRLKINCDRTKAANSNWALCNGTDKQEARDAANQIVISKNTPETLLGRYKLALRCSKSTLVTLALEVRMDSSVVSDNIFKTVPFTCPL